VKEPTKFLLYFKVHFVSSGVSSLYFSGSIEELVWKNGDRKQALKFITACAPTLRYLECDINLLDAPEFPHLTLNEFKSLKIKANTDRIMSALFQQSVRHIDMSELPMADGVSFAQGLFR
jgi:hypothetical protein